MTLASQTIVVENDQITVALPAGAALAIRRVGHHTARIYLLREEDLVRFVEGESPSWEWPEDVRQFADAQGILSHLDAAIKAAKDTFGPDRRVIARLKQNEYGDRFVDIHVTLQDEEPEAEAEKYAECLAKWAPALPPHLGELIQLSTSWAS